jgi:hypothetical protein
VALQGTNLQIQQTTKNNKKDKRKHTFRKERSCGWRAKVTENKWADNQQYTFWITLLILNSPPTLPGNCWPKGKANDAFSSIPGNMHWSCCQPRIQGWDHPWEPELVSYKPSLFICTCLHLST